MINEFKVIVSLVITNDNEEVLLGKRSPDEDVFPNMWGIPGGKIEVDSSLDNALEETLKRESREEMGIEVEIGAYLESVCKIKEGQGKLYIIFAGKHISGTPQALEDTVEVRWWKVKDIDKDSLTPGTYQNIQQALAASKSSDSLR